MVSFVYISVTILAILFVGKEIANIVFSFKYRKYDLDDRKIFIEIKNNLNKKSIYFISKNNQNYNINNENLLILEKWNNIDEINKNNNNIENILENETNEQNDNNKKFDQLYSLDDLKSWETLANNSNKAMLIISFIFFLVLFYTIIMFILKYFTDENNCIKTVLNIVLSLNLIIILIKDILSIIIFSCSNKIRIFINSELIGENTKDSIISLNSDNYYNFYFSLSILICFCACFIFLIIFIIS